MTKGVSRFYYFPWMAGVLVLAGIVHIVSVLALPYMAARDAFGRLAAVAAVNQLTMLPKPEHGKEIAPFGDPALVTAVCRYDISETPFRLSAVVSGESLVLISFHDRFGKVFYSLTDRAAVRGRIEAVVVTAGQKEALEAEDSEDGPGSDLRLVTTRNQGFILLRSLAEQPGDYARMQQLFENVSCAPDQG